MSDGAGSEVEVSSEGGSDAEYGEAASQVEEGAAEQAERGTAVSAIPAWAAELLERLAEGEQEDFRSALGAEALSDCSSHTEDYSSTIDDGLIQKVARYL